MSKQVVYFVINYTIMINLKAKLNADLNNLLERVKHYCEMIKIRENVEDMKW